MKADLSATALEVNVFRDPALTYQGSLQILGSYDRESIQRLDSLLGGAILGAGLIAGAAALTGTAAAAPAALAAAIWGWVDQKSEATRLLSRAIDGVSRRLLRTRGYERRNLIAAAHTTIVAAAFFDALHDYLGRAGYSALEITEKEKVRLVADEVRLDSDPFIISLYSTPVPAPSPVCGYEENVVNVQRWLASLTTRTHSYFSGLAAWKSQPEEFESRIVADAIQHYRSYYLKLAGDVPEFLIWASFGEHAATRHQIHQLHTELRAALDDHGPALSRVERLLLALSSETVDEPRDLGLVLNRANQGVLDEPIVPTEALLGGDQNVFPRVRDIYVNPHYKLCRADRSSRIADEQWWHDRRAYDDIELLLATYMTTPDAVRLPLLLLGHPGAGKSLLTRVLAARLPPADYTVVHVALRRVDAGGSVLDQIQQALDLTTNGRAVWHELAGQTKNTVRVVLLDGLDELLQAIPGHRHDYLQNVMEFQEREVAQGLPVAVIVTSRTVVADNVAVPEGATVIKLEDFNGSQISEWISRWNTAALSGSQDQTMSFSAETALRQMQLAGQPLLLLMLALYSSDPGAAPLEAAISTVALYRQLVENFARREVAKSRSFLNEAELVEAVDEQLWRLTVAAFAMINRGRQNVTEEQLEGDLGALVGDLPNQKASVRGKAVIGQFFFVHAAEAQLEADTRIRRSYEFLHATFSEYLVANEVVRTLKVLSDTPQTTRWSPRELDDDFLHTLLSHQVLAVSQPIVDFARQLFSELSGEHRARIVRMLGSLITNARRRHTSDRYAGYTPTPIDRVRNTAVYSANLVMMATVFSENGQPVPLMDLLPNSDSPLATWRSTVALWASALDAGSWQAILSSVTYEDGGVRALQHHERLPPEFSDVLHARLIGDAPLESRLRFGIAVCDGTGMYVHGDRWEESMIASLIPLLLFPSDVTAGPLLIGPLPSTPTQGRQAVAEMLSTVLKLRAWTLAPEVVLALSKILFECADGTPDPYAVAAAVAARPETLETMPELADPRLYASGGWGIWLLLSSTTGKSQRQREILNQLCQNLETIVPNLPSRDECTFDQLLVMVRQILRAYRSGGLSRANLPLTGPSALSTVPYQILQPPPIDHD